MTERWCGVEDPTASVEQLGIALALLHEPAATDGRQRRAGLADERSEVLPAEAQLAIERDGEVGAEAHVQKPAGRDEYDCHCDGKRGRHAEPDR